jgi:hypothetical protein
MPIVAGRGGNRTPLGVSCGLLTTGPSYGGVESLTWEFHEAKQKHFEVSAV